MQSIRSVFHQRMWNLGYSVKSLSNWAIFGYFSLFLSSFIIILSRCLHFFTIWSMLGFVYLNRYPSIYVTAPTPENLKTLFEFVCKGLEALDYKVNQHSYAVYSIWLIYVLSLCQRPMRIWADLKCWFMYVYINICMCLCVYSFLLTFPFVAFS